MSHLLCSIVLLFLFKFHYSNGQMVQIMPDSISASEGSPFQFCFTVVVSTDVFNSEVMLDISTSSPEIAPVDAQLVFPAGTPPANLMGCVNGTVLSDNNVEPFEVISNLFDVTLTVDSSTSNVDPLGTLLITDTTSNVPVGFEQPSYTALEGDTISVCVTLDGNIETSFFEVTLESNVGTNDLLVVTSPLIFDTSTTNQLECSNVIINNDTSFEPQEMFALQLTSAASPLSIDPTRSMATIIIFDMNADCGAPPTGAGLDVVLSGPTMEFQGALVANRQAMATYTCQDTSLILTGTNPLVCMSPSDTTPALWTPADPPTCEPAPTTEPPTEGDSLATTEEATEVEMEMSSTDGDQPDTTMGIMQTMLTGSTSTTPTASSTVDAQENDDNTGRNIGIGVGVGIGGVLIILLIVLLIVFLVFRYKRGKTHSKYILNYSTVYGTDQRPAKRELQPTETTGLAADEPNLGEAVSDAQAV